MGNLNRRRAIGAARAAVRDDGGCLSRAAPQRFTADGRLRGHKRTIVLSMRSPDGAPRALPSASPTTGSALPLRPCLCKHVTFWQAGSALNELDQDMRD